MIDLNTEQYINIWLQIYIFWLQIAYLIFLIEALLMNTTRIILILYLTIYSTKLH